MTSDTFGSVASTSPRSAERFAVLTTCNREGWEQYGRRMLETYDQYWADDVPIYVYAEGFDPGRRSAHTRTLPAWLDAFKARHAGNPRAHGITAAGYDFHYDCVRFAHKVAAVTDAAETIETDVLIWADADTVTHAPVDAGWLSSLFPATAYIAWLEREGHYPECGLYMLRCSHPAHREMMRRLRTFYEHDTVFGLGKTTDCHVLQHVIEAAQREGLIVAHSLSGDARTHRHPLINGPLGARLDHLKGQRKSLGRSQASDLLRPRGEAYWCSSK